MATKKKPLIKKKVCSKCLEEKPNVDGFYLTSDDLIHEDGRLGVCKVCLDSIVEFDDVENVIEVMRRIDKPFIIDEYNKSLSYEKPFGEYMRRMGMRQNRNLNYSHSVFDENLNKFKAKNSSDLNKKLDVNDVVKFKITPDILVKWGTGYSESELFTLEQFYKDMDAKNVIDTPQHIASLKLLCKLNLKQNKALDEGDSGTFAKLNTQYNKILQDSGFRPIDKRGANESMGIRSFSQIWEEIEKDGFIPKHDIEVTQDIVDGTVLHTENYTRRLLGMQTVSEPSGETPKVEDYL